MDCQQFEELAGAYALGATSELEQHAAQAHLLNCDRCQHTVRELQTVTDLLLLAVPFVEPSPLLKDRVIDVVTADAKEYAASQRVAQRSPQRRWWHYTQTRLAVACLLLLLLLAGSLTSWNVVLQHQLSSVSANQQINYKIEATSPDTTISGEAMYLPQLHVTLLTIKGLPSLAGNEVYQGWHIKDHHAGSLGLLNIQNGTATLDFPGDLRTDDAIAVSREPGPQASQGEPRGPIVALATLQKKQGLFSVEPPLAFTSERKVEI